MADNQTTQTTTRLTASLPGNGKVQTYQTTGDTLVVFDFDVSEAIFSSKENDLVITVEGHGIVVFEDFLLHSQNDSLPTFQLIDGEQFPGDVYLFAFDELGDSGEEIETAAGAGGGGSGAGAYLDDQGDLYRSLDALQGQGDPTREGEDSATRSTQAFSSSSTTEVANTPPTVNGTLNLEMDEDGSLVILDTQILSLVSDNPGSFVAVTDLNVSGGTLTKIAAGSWLFVPDQDFNGSVSVTFSVSDGQYTVGGTGGIEVAPVNDAPVAVDDVAAVTEDTIITGSVASNDTDVDNTADELTYTLNGPAPAGLTSFNTADGTFTFDASSYDYLADGVTEDITITYTVTDKDGASDTDGTLVITVTGTNDAPTAALETIAATEDAGGRVRGDVRDVINDVDGEKLLVTNIENEDGDSAAVTPGTATTIVGEYGTLTINANGSYSYKLDDTNGSVDGLDDGESITESFTFTVSDGDATASNDIKVTINGTNDAPTAALETIAATEDAGGRVRGDVRDVINDVDEDKLLVTNIENEDGDSAAVTPGTATTIVGEYGTLTINANGSYSYKLDDTNGSVDGLDDGESITESFTFTVSDGDATASNDIKVTINGTNDAPTAALETIAATEDAGGRVRGDVRDVINDVDGEKLLVTNIENEDGDSAAVTPGTATTIVGEYGTLTINANGSYSYKLDDTNGSVDGLDDGESITESFTFTVSDGDATASNDIKVTINGTNDAPTAALETIAATEDAGGRVRGDVRDVINDVDGEKLLVTNIENEDGDSAAVIPGTATTIVGEYGTLTINANGSYSYKLDDTNGSVDGLDDGESITESFTFTVSDGDATASNDIKVTINGTNDAPTAALETIAATEDAGGRVRGDVRDVINDVDGEKLLVTNIENEDGDSAAVIPGTATTIVGEYGTLTINANGSYSYKLDDTNGSVDGLDDGESITESFTFTVSDGDATASNDIKVTINGTNDAPTAALETIAATEDAGGRVRGDVRDVINDVDGEKLLVTNIENEDGDSAAVTPGTATTIVGEYGTLTINANGSYSYKLDDTNGSVDGLDDGESITESFTFTVSDGDATASNDIKVTINGTNDAPTAALETIAATEDAGGRVRGDVRDVINDVDGDKLLVTNIENEDGDSAAVTPGTATTIVGEYGTLTINANGSYSYKLDDTNGSVDGLDDGESITESFTFTVSDGDATASNDIKVTINGTNDAPTAALETIAATEDAGGRVRGDVRDVINDVDGDKLLVTNIENEDGDSAAVTPGTATTIVGEYGTLTINANGSYSYKLDDTNGSVDGLDDGESITESFTFTVSDGDATASNDIKVTINGTNDAPTAALETIAATEDAGGRVRGDVRDVINDVDGEKLLVTNIENEDGDSAAVTPGTATTIVGEYGTLTINANGSYSYKLDDTNGSVDGLDDGESITESFTFTVSDGDATASNDIKVTINGTNDAPTAALETIAATEDAGGRVRGDVRDVINDVDGDKLLVTNIENEDGDSAAVTPGTATTIVGEYGTLTINANGSYSYKLDDTNGSVDGLDDGESITESFTFTVSDGDATASNDIKVTINGTNDAPTAALETIAATEDAGGRVRGDVRDVINDVDGDKLLVTNIENEDGDSAAVTPGTATTIVGEYGTLTINANGSYSYKLDDTNPTVNALDDGEPLSESFTFTASDGDATASNDIKINITGTNDAPTAVADTGEVDEDRSVNIDVLANDTDAEGHDLSVVGPLAAENGTVSINTDGTINYQPNTNFNGTDTITFMVSDGHGGLTSSTATITVNSINDGPVVTDDTAEVDEDGSVTITVLDDDSDIDGGTLSISGDAVAKNGTVVVNDDGTLDYTPNANFNGTDTITFMVSDGQGGFTQSVTTVTVNPVNDAPVTVEDTAEVDEDGTVNNIDVLANDTDIDGDTLSIEGTPTAEHGTVTVNDDGTINYKPDANFNGTDTITYVASDGLGGTTEGTATITVNSINDGPVVTNDTAEVDEDGSVTITVLDDDSDIDGGTLSISGDAVAKNGTVVVNDDGTLDYTPNANFNGTDTITFMVSDGQGGFTQSVTTVTVNPVNDAPVTVEDTAEVDEDGTVNNIDILGNDTDIDGDTLSIEGTPTAEHGTVTVNDDGTINYKPDANFNGTDTITYVASDGLGGTTEGTATITVNSINDGPVVTDDTAEVDEDGSVTITVLDDDSDIDGGTLSISGDAVAKNGTVVVNDDGTLDYTPNANFNGTDTITFMVSDGQGGFTQSVTTVTVNPVNDAPVTVEDTAEVDEDGTVNNIDILGNDTDIDGDTLSIEGTPTAEHGTVTVNDDGTINYKPDADFNGTDTITYVASDGLGGTTEGTATITVNSINDGPVVTDDTAEVDEDGSVTITVLDDDSDIDGGTLSISGDAVAKNGTVVVNDDGTLDYTPNANFNGTDTITFMVSDGQGGFTQSVTTVTVNPVNDAPVTVEDTAEVDEDGTVNNINVLGNDTDIDGDTFSIEGTPTAEHGTVTVNDDGTINYKPDADFNGTDTITYVASDGLGGTTEGTVDVTVNPVNDLPEGETFTVDATDGDAIIDFTNQISDIEDDASATDDLITQIVIKSLPDHGHLETLDGGEVKIGGIYDANDIKYVADDDYNTPDTTGGFIGVRDDADRDISNWGEPVKDANGNDDPSARSTTLADGTTITVSTGDGSALTQYNGEQNHVGSGVGDADGWGINSGETISVDFDGAKVSHAQIGMDGLGGHFVPNAAGNTIATATWFAYDGDKLVASGEVVNTTPGLDYTLDIGQDQLKGQLFDHIEFSTKSGTNSNWELKSVDVEFGQNDEFTYAPIDSNGDEGNISTVNVHLYTPDTLTNEAPIAGNDALTTNEDTKLEIDFDTLLGNDTDTDGDTLTLTGVGNAVGGIVEMTNGQVVFTPNANFNGEASFTYTVSDGNNHTTTGTTTVTVNPVNDAPVTAGDAAEVDEDGTINNINVLGNDTDIDGDTLSIEGTPTAEHGTVTVNDDGTINYKPDANFNGTDTITYVASDGLGGTTEGTATITVNSINDGPVVTDDTAEVDEDGSVTITVLDDDSDIDGGTLSISGDAVAKNGTVVVNDDGTLDYTPNANFNGTDTITFMVSDGQGGFTQSVTTVTVNPVNDAPVTVEDTAEVDEDGTVNNINVLGNDTDIDGDTLSIEGTPTAEHGTVTVNDDGTINYKPDANFNGTDTITYVASDGLGGTTEGTATITVNSINDGPVVTDDTAEVDEDGSVTITVLDDDSDIDGGTLSISGDAVAKNGTVVVNDDGTLDYTPNANFNGTDTITFMVSDGQGGFTQSVTTVTVNPVNDAPVTVEDTAEVDEDGTVNNINVLGNDTDIDGDTLSIEGTPTAEHGTVTVNDDGTINYKPDANFNGTDTITYVASDGLGGTKDGTVDVTVNPVNDLPTLDLDGGSHLQVSFVEETASYNNIVGVYKVDAQGNNASDPQIIINNQNPTLPVGQIVGTLAEGEHYEFFIIANGASSNPDLADSQLSFTMDGDRLVLNIDGSPANNTYFSQDEHNPDSLTGAPRFDANGNELPGGHFIITTDGDVTTVRMEDLRDGGDNDYRDVVLKITAVEATEGTGFEATFVEDAGSVHVASAGIEITDVEGALTEATVTLTHAQTGDELRISELPDGITAVTAPDGQGNIVVTLTATDGTASPADFEAAIKAVAFYNTSEDPSTEDRTINVTITDDGGATATAQTIIHVTAVNDGPVGGDDAFTITEDNSQTFTFDELLANDNDVDNTPSELNIINVSTTANSHGTVTIDSANRTVTFTPDDDYNGPAEFNYGLQDANHGYDTVAVKLTVTPDNDTPVAIDDVFGTTTVTEGESFTLTTPDSGVNATQVLNNWATEGVTVSAHTGNGMDPDTWDDANFGTKNVSFTEAGQGYAYSGLAVSAPGQIDGGEIDLLDGKDTTDTELLEVSFDRPMESVTLELSALFDGIEDPNQPGDDQGPYDHGHIELARVAAFDANGDLLGYVDVQGTPNGLATVTLDVTELNYGLPIASVSVMPLDDGAGDNGYNSDFLLRSVSGETMGEVEGTFYEDQEITLDASDLLNTANTAGETDSDIDGDTLSVISVGNAQHGEVSFDPNTGKITFDPEDDFSGQATFQYTISDGKGGEDTATVTLNITPVNDAPVIDLNDTGQHLDINAADADSWGYNLVGMYVLDDAGNPVATEVLYHHTDVNGPEGYNVGELLTHVEDGQTPHFFFLNSGNTNADRTGPAFSEDTQVTFSKGDDGQWYGTGIDENGNQMTFKAFFDDTSLNKDNHDRFQLSVADENGTQTMSVEEYIGRAVDYDDIRFTITPQEDDNTGFTTTFTEGGDAVSIAGALSITDVDSTIMSKAVITLTNAQAGDVLNTEGVQQGLFIDTDVTDTGAIVVTLSGTATRAEYQSAIKSITFDNTNDDAANGIRTVTVQVTDADGRESLVSNAATTTINVVDNGSVVEPTDPDMVNWDVTGQNVVLASDLSESTMLGVYSVIDGKPSDPEIILTNSEDSHMLGDVLKTFGEDESIHFFIVPNAEGVTFSPDVKLHFIVDGDGYLIASGNTQLPAQFDIAGFNHGNEDAGFLFEPGEGPGVNVEHWESTTVKVDGALDVDDDNSGGGHGNGHGHGNGWGHTSHGNGWGWGHHKGDENDDLDDDLAVDINGTRSGLFEGGSGNDYAYGADGNDTLIGGRGDDTLHGGAQGDEVSGGIGNDYITGADGMDILDGGQGNDTIYGGSQDDLLIGGSGDDLLVGNSGNNLLVGGAGNDTIYGGDNDDIIIGGSGTDIIHTGEGSDTIFIDKSALGEGVNTIEVHDFTPGKDVLEFGDGVVKEINVDSSDGMSLVIGNEHDSNDDVVVKLLGVTPTELTDHHSVVDSHDTADQLIQQMIDSAHNDQN